MVMGGGGIYDHDAQETKNAHHAGHETTSRNRLCDGRLCGEEENLRREEEERRI